MLDREYQKREDDQDRALTAAIVARHLGSVGDLLAELEQIPVSRMNDPDGVELAEQIRDAIVILASWDIESD